MAVILGIDLGTQSLKAMLLDTEQGPLAVESREYALLFPQLDWAEEQPEQWWDALKGVLSTMKQQMPQVFSQIAGIGLSGQMHGMVPLDRDGVPVSNAIIWVDQRSKKQVERIEGAYTQPELAQQMHNRIFTGFGFPSLLWMKEERPEQFSRIHRICSPKDYLRMRLIGGEPQTESSDASSMTGFDFGRRRWNTEALQKFQLPEELFPPCFESTEIAGQVTEQAAAETGLPKGIPVVYGSGDVAAVSLGCGMYREGVAISNIGTGGNYNCYSARDVYDPRLRLQQFCNAVDQSYLLCGAILSGGLSLSWLKKQVLHIDTYETLNAMVESTPPGADGLIFLPYLGGERAPHMDFNAMGTFFGLRHCHDDRYFCRAVMEGVTYALKDSQTVLEELGIRSQTVIASGGGAKSPAWLQMQADILEKEIVVTEVEEEACLGACLIAGIGLGIFSSAAEACAHHVRLSSRRYVPDPAHVTVYRDKYAIYRELYPQLKELMRRNAK